MKTKAVYLLAAFLWAACVVVAVCPDRLETAEDARLKTISGGACEECKSGTGECSGTTCKEEVEEGKEGEEDGKYKKRTGTSITPMSCQAVAKGSSGLTDCSTNTPETCWNVMECTDKDCEKCSPADPEKKDTKCSLTGTYCVGE